MSKTLCCLSTVILILAAPYTFSSTETTFHNFTGGTDGADPVADLLYDPTSGLVYGTTDKGGGAPACARGCGTVFAIRPDGSGYTVLYRFAGGITDGANPQAGLAVDSAGNLYGTTYSGGAQNLGAIFKLTPIGGGMFSESLLHSFSGADGSHPESRLALDSSGDLYGTTFGGGAHGRGVVFELSPSGTFLEYSFSGPDGSHPKAGVELDANQNIWGTTSVGGTANLGVVFRMSFNGNEFIETFVFPFAGSDGANPYAAVTLDAAGDVFGTTRAGGSPACAFAAAGCGVVFELQASGSGFTENLLYTFTGGTDGSAPVADLTLALDVAGNPYLYGTASQAGVIGGTCPAAGCGTAFELCGPNSACQGSLTWTEYTLLDFVGRNGGKIPLANILAFSPVAANGDTLGFPPPNGKGGCTSGCMSTASSGGTSGSGTIVQLSN